MNLVFPFEKQKEMENNLYNFHYSATYSGQSTTTAPPPPSKSVFGKEDDVSEVLRDKVASHPLFPHLLHAYIDCHKVIHTYKYKM